MTVAQGLHRSICVYSSHFGPGEDAFAFLANFDNIPRVACGVTYLRYKNRQLRPPNNLVDAVETYTMGSYGFFLGPIYYRHPFSLSLCRNSDPG